MKNIKKREIFVFGSNRAGRHGKGAALYARSHYGAKNGVGEGLQGDSYAIPTKDENLKTLPLSEIKKHVDVFLKFAEENPQLTFRLTAIGTGLAGYKAGDIAPFFGLYPQNVILPSVFMKFMVVT